MFSERLTHVLARGLAVWLLIMLAETIHGVARTILLVPLVGDLKSRQIGVFTGSLLILAITLMFVRWLKASKAAHFLLVGIMWVSLTIGFEMMLGRVVMDLSWERILADYDLSGGGLMPIGLLVMFVAPLVFAKMYDEV